MKNFQWGNFVTNNDKIHAYQQTIHSKRVKVIVPKGCPWLIDQLTTESLVHLSLYNTGYYTFLELPHQEALKLFTFHSNYS